MLSVRAGLPPPRAVMQWFAGGLEAWSASEGEADLRKALGLLPGSGGDQLFEKFEREREIERRMIDMDILVFLGEEHAGWTTKDAIDKAAMIACERQPLATRKPLSRPLTQNQLHDHYKSRKEKQSREIIAHWVNRPGWVDEFLGQFGIETNFDYYKSELKSRR